MHWYGSTLMICSRHKLAAAAKKAARRCEAHGGSWHYLYHITPLRRRRLR